MTHNYFLCSVTTSCACDVGMKSRGPWSWAQSKTNAVTNKHAFKTLPSPLFPLGTHVVPSHPLTRPVGDGDPTLHGNALEEPILRTALCFFSLNLPFNAELQDDQRLSAIMLDSRRNVTSLLIYLRALKVILLLHSYEVLWISSSV